MSTKAKRHIHKYRRVNMGGTQVWSCALGDCNHYMPAHMEEMVPGKTSICWGCENKFQLDPVNMRDDMPKCNECRPSAKTLVELIDSLGVK